MLWDLNQEEKKTAELSLLSNISGTLQDFTPISAFGNAVFSSSKHLRLLTVALHKPPIRIKPRRISSRPCLGSCPQAAVLSFLPAHYGVAP